LNFNVHKIIDLTRILIQYSNKFSERIALVNSSAPID